MVKQKRFTTFNVARFTFLGILAGVISLFTSAIFNAFNIPIFFTQNEFVSFKASVVDVNLREQVTSSSFFPKIGEAILNFFQNTLQLNVNNLLSIIIGAIAVIMIGRLAVGFFQQNKFVIQWRVALSFFIGSTILGILFLPILFGSMAYGLLIGIALQLLVNSPALNWVRE